MNCGNNRTKDIREKEACAPNLCNHLNLCMIKCHMENEARKMDLIQVTKPHYLKYIKD